MANTLTPFPGRAIENCQEVSKLDDMYLIVYVPDVVENNMFVASFPELEINAILHTVIREWSGPVELRCRVIVTSDSINLMNSFLWGNFYIGCLIQSLRTYRLLQFLSQYNCTEKKMNEILCINSIMSYQNKT